MCEACLPRSAVLSRRLLLTGGAVVVAGASRHPHRPNGSRTANPPVLAAVAVTDNLSIYPRDAWATEPPRGELLAENVKFLLVHHTAGRQPSEGNVSDELRSIYRFHTGPDKGWPDVCYNFFVDPQGAVWEGRAGSLAGPIEASATGGNQGFAQLVCVLGDFTSVMPTEAALVALERTLTWLAKRYQIDTQPDATVSFVSRGSNLWPARSTVTAATISGHREMSATECPGDTFYRYVITTLRENVHAEAQAAPSSPTTSATTHAVASTAAAIAPTTTDARAGTAQQSETAPARQPSTTAKSPTSNRSTSAPRVPKSASNPVGGSPQTSGTIGVWIGVAGGLIVAALSFIIGRRRTQHTRAIGSLHADAEEL